jgi:hypothetical protein
VYQASIGKGVKIWLEVSGDWKPGSVWEQKDTPQLCSTCVILNWGKIWIFSLISSLNYNYVLRVNLGIVIALKKRIGEKNDYKKNFFSFIITALYLCNPIPIMCWLPPISSCPWTSPDAPTSPPWSKSGQHIWLSPSHTSYPCTSSLSIGSNSWSFLLTVSSPSREPSEFLPAAGALGQRSARASSPSSSFLFGSAPSVEQQQLDVDFLSHSPSASSVSSPAAPTRRRLSLLDLAHRYIWTYAAAPASRARPPYSLIVWPCALAVGRAQLLVAVLPPRPRHDCHRPSPTSSALWPPSCRLAFSPLLKHRRPWWR